MNVRLLVLTALMAGLPSVVSAQAVSPTDASAQALTNEQLTKELRELKNLLKEVLNEQQRQGFSNGRLKNQMQDPQFAREFGDAVHTTLRRSGTLVVSNRMATNQYLIVNGTQHRVLAGARLEIAVPTGTVSTRLPGQEIVNWTVAAPTYSQGIDISPKYTALRPPSPAATLPGSPPAYETPPTFETPPAYVAPPTYVSPWPMFVY